MKKMFVEWITLLAVTIVVFIIIIVIAASIFCRPYFPFCLAPMISGILIAGFTALLVSSIIYLIFFIIKGGK